MNKSKNEYTPPRNIWDVYNGLNFDEPLESDDPRRVETEAGRGDFSFSNLLQYLGVDPRSYEFRGVEPPKRVYTAFCGHRGCGKSTELRRLCHQLDKDGLFMVIFLNASYELDTNNLRYADVFMALAKKLFERLEKESVSIDQIYLDNLESWFKQRVIIDEKKREYALDIKAGIEAKSGIPFFLQLFANMTTAFKNNSTYKEELRKDITNTFSQFALAFNGLLEAVRETLPDHAKRKALLFIVDDLEKLPRDDARSIFIGDVNQLQQIESNFIYSAPIDFLYEGSQFRQLFLPMTLPMIKVTEKDGSKNEKGYSILREMIFRRADRSLFTPPSVVDKIIEYSGGNPRHVLQLMTYAYSHTKNEVFDEEAVDRAIQDMKVSFQRFLTLEDYETLYRIDCSKDYTTNEQVQNLLHQLALLEYNEFWWRSHPAVRLIPAYQELAKKSKKSKKKP